MSMFNPRVKKNKKGVSVYRDKVRGQRKSGELAVARWNSKGEPEGAKWDTKQAPPQYVPNKGFKLNKAMIKRNAKDKRDWDKLGSRMTGERRRRIVK
jgi:hypothetical protein